MRLRRPPLVTVQYDHGNFRLDLTRVPKARTYWAGFADAAVAQLLHLQGKHRPEIVFDEGCAFLKARFRAAGGMLQ